MEVVAVRVSAALKIDSRMLAATMMMQPLSMLVTCKKKTLMPFGDCDGRVRVVQFLQEMDRQAPSNSIAVSVRDEYEGKFW